MTVFSILTGSDVTKVKSEVTIVFSGKFYISYQNLIAVTTLEVTVYSVFVLFFSEKLRGGHKTKTSHGSLCKRCSVLQEITLTRDISATIKPI